MSGDRYWCSVHPQSASYVRTIELQDGRTITGQCCSLCCEPIDPVMAELVGGVASGPSVTRRTILGWQRHVHAVAKSKGWHSGTHVGRVVIRGNGWFKIETSHGLVPSVSHKHCIRLQRADGYRYASDDGARGSKHKRKVR